MMNGLYLIKPTSIVSTGSGNSSSISANGSVTFNSCETLSLNGVFSADYDNYMIVMRSSTTGPTYYNARLRSSGTDATASNYTQQYLYADATTVGGARSASQAEFEIGYSAAVSRAGLICYLFGPYLAQPTATRSVVGADYLSAYIHDTACTHSLSTSYDGLTIICETAGRPTTGLVGVYGMVK